MYLFFPVIFRCQRSAQKDGGCMTVISSNRDIAHVDKLILSLTKDANDLNSIAIHRYLMKMAR